MREYRRIRSGVAVFLAAYFLGGLSTLLLPQMEVFPVYSWFLFSLTPQTGPQYGLVLTAMNGRELNPPRLYQEAVGLVDAPHSVTVFKLVQRLGAALENGGTDAQSYRVLLEHNWLPPNTRYELVRLTENPLTRWKRLETFTSPEASP